LSNQLQRLVMEKIRWGADRRALRRALADLVDRYVTLVDSGDCGHWNPEDEPVVKAARAALDEVRS